MGFIFFLAAIGFVIFCITNEEEVGQFIVAAIIFGIMITALYGIYRIIFPNYKKELKTVREDIREDGEIHHEEKIPCWVYVKSQEKFLLGMDYRYTIKFGAGIEDVMYYDYGENGDLLLFLKHCDLEIQHSIRKTIRFATRCPKSYYKQAVLKNKLGYDKYRY